MGYAKKGTVQNIDNLYGEVSLIKGKGIFVWIKLANATEGDVDMSIKERRV